MSDSVANLTVKVDTKSVSAAVKALDALAVKAGVVYKQMERLGNGAAAMGKAQEAAEKKARQSESALAKMEKRLEDGAKKYEQIIRLVNKHALSEGMRADTMNRVNRAFEQYNRVAGNVNATTLQMDRATRRYNQAIEQTKTGIESVVTLERQRASERRKNEREQEAAAKSTERMNKSAEKARQQEIKDVLALERVMQQAQSRVAGIIGRAGRQLPSDIAAGISSQMLQNLDRYSAVLKQYGVNSLQAAKAKGEFDRAAQAASGSIAKLGGLLPRISDNARTISAAFGAANASMGGFSRVVFSTTAALSALSGALGLREIIQAGLEIDKFINTLKTVSNGALDFQRNLNFLMSEADRVGFAVGEVGNSFARLSLAMKGAGFTGNETREVFSNLTAASRNFGLSSADTMGVIRALEQSMSKGKFMAEEVRLQMGDRLPIAMTALERAVTKVDGKTSDLNKRFEEGSIDVARYATEFVRQIYLLSGGADTLGRTSQSVQAAFGRLGTELTRVNMIFKEAGFDQAVISVTDQFRELIKTARESGIVEELAKATLLLANNIDLLVGALSGFALVGAARLLVGLASKWLAVAAAIGAVGAAIAYVFRSPERQFALFDQEVKSFEQTYTRLKNQVEAANSAVASSVNNMASSAKSDLEQVAASYEKMGFAASVALGKALKANAAEREKEIREMEKSEQAAYERLTNNFQINFSNQLNAIYSSLKDPAALEAFAQLNESFLSSSINLVEYSNKLTDLTRGISGATTPANQLITLLKDPENFGATSVLKAIQNFAGLATALATARGQVAAMRAEATALESGGAIPSPAPSEPIEPPRYSLPGAFGRYVGVRAAQDQAAGLKILQNAYRQITGDTRVLSDTTAFLTSVRARATAGDQDAKRVLDDYNEALAKNDKKATGAEKSLRKYTETLEIEIATHQGLLDAYKQSTLAGEDMEVQIKAQTKALDYGVKGSEAYKKALAAILPLMRERTQQEKDTEAVKANTEQREREIALLEKERSLLGQSVSLREQELAAFRARQQLQGRDPAIIDEAERLARDTVKLRQENQQLENSYNELANIGVRAFEQVGDAITEAFAKGEIRALNFGNVIRGVMSSIVQSILRLGVVNPIINSIFSGTMLPTLGAGLSVLGGGGAAAAAGGGGGGIMQLLGLSSLIPKEGILGSLGISSLLSTPLISSTLSSATPAALGAMGGAYGPASAAQLAAAGGVPGISLGSFLGAAGLGFGAGTFLNSMLGGNQMGGMAGSGLGSAAGALLAGAGMLGPLGPVAAALIGGLAGGGLGGLIGPKPSVQGYGFRLQSAGYGPDATPTNAMARSLLPISRQFYNESGAAAFQQAEQVVAATNAYLAQRGLLVGGVSVVGGNRFGPDYSWADAGSVGEGFTRLRFGAASDEELNRALSGRTFGGVEQLQQFVEGFISLQDMIKSLTQDPVPEFTKQMDALIDSFAQAAAKAREYGVNEEELLKARDKAITKLEEQRNLSLRDMALGLEIRRLTAQGMEQEAERIQLSYNSQKEIEAFTASLDALGITAEEKSKLLIALEETQALERAKIIKESTKNIRDYLDSLRTSSELSGTTGMGRLTAAQDIFNRDLAAAQAGDKEAISRITQSADTLLNLARSIYGSTASFYDIRNQVVPGLEGLVNAPPTSGPQSLVNLADVPLVSQTLGARQDAALTESLGYSQRFDEKLAALLPIAEDIRDAVQQTNQAVQAPDFDINNTYGFFGGAGEDAGGGFGGDMGGGGGMAAALGAAFRYGRVTPFAYGGIPDLVSAPTLAPMALFGEAGPEAIMPLRRGPDGRLGVEVNGNGSQAVVAELRAVRNEIINLRETVDENDRDQSATLVDVVSDLRIQIGELREELRTTRLRAQ